MQSKASFVSFLVFLTGFSSLGAFAQGTEKPVLVVMDLSVIDAKTNQTLTLEQDSLTSQLIGDFQKSEKYSVIERAQRDSILKAQGLKQRGLFETEQLVQLGQNLLAQKIVGGSVWKISDGWSFSLVLVDAKLGKVERGARGEYKGSMRELQKQMIYFVGYLSGSDLSAMACGKLERLKTERGISAILAFGLGFVTACGYIGSEVDYSHYKKATLDDSIRFWKETSLSADRFKNVCTGLTVVSVGSWWYYQRRLNRYEKISRGVTMKPTDSILRKPVESDEISKISNRINWISETTFLTGSLAVVFAGLAQEKYSNYHFATTDQAISREKSYTRAFDWTRNILTTTAVLSASSWLYYQRKEDRLLKDYLGPGFDKKGRGQVQFGLVPDPRGKLGARPGLVYTRRF